MMRIAALVAVFGSAAALGPERDLASYSFEDYTSEFQKLYGATDKVQREHIFDENKDIMMKHNAHAAKTWYMAPNSFMDWTNKEFQLQRLKGHARPRDFGALGAAVHKRGLGDVPASLDWRTKPGVVTPVKDQGGCGSCWAFSTVETFESLLAIATQKPAPVLSPQQVVSCAPNPDQCGGTGGCEGSTQWLGFNYTQTAGLTLESSYPYTGSDSKCQAVTPVAINSGYVRLPTNSYTDLIDAVANVGPIAISVAAGSFGWQMYGGGVYSGSCGYDEDHAVQMVGYGTDGADYWLVRNSWGSGWGEEGYIRIKRFGEGKEPCGMDTTPGDGGACKGDTTPLKACGLCAILVDSSYPTGLKDVSVEMIV